MNVSDFMGVDTEALKLDSDGFFYAQTDEGKMVLPFAGRRCLFVLKEGAKINRHAIAGGFRAFGYLIEEDTIYLPLYRRRLSVEFLERWKYQPGPDFFNGTNRPTTEAFLKE